MCYFEHFVCIEFSNYLELGLHQFLEVDLVRPGKGNRLRWTGKEASEQFVVGNGETYLSANHRHRHMETLLGKPNPLLSHCLWAQEILWF
jgi:hypothetical protein